MVDLSSRISPFTSTVIFFERSPFATAVVTSAILRTCPVRFAAIMFTLSVRSFHVPATPLTLACPPSLPSEHRLLVRGELVQTTIQIVRLHERDVLAEQIAHRATLEPMSVPISIRCQEKSTGSQPMSSECSASSFPSREGGSGRQPKLVQSQLIPQKSGHPARRPTDEADATAWRSAGSTPHRNREPAQDDPLENNAICFGLPGAFIETSIALLHAALWLSLISLR